MKKVQIEITIVRTIRINDDASSNQVMNHAMVVVNEILSDTPLTDHITTSISRVDD